MLLLGFVFPIANDDDWQRILASCFAWFGERKKSLFTKSIFSIKITIDGDGGGGDCRFGVRAWAWVNDNEQRSSSSRIKHVVGRLVGWSGPGRGSMGDAANVPSARGFDTTHPSTGRSFQIILYNF